MTSINAIRFDRYSGAMACDEQRHWNPERMKIYAADKIRRVTSEEILKDRGIAAAYGNTGTSTIGDEIKSTVQKRIEEYYQGVLKGGKDETITMDKLASIVFDVMIDIKHTHINDELITKYGFGTEDLCRGYYMQDGNKVEIKEDDVAKEVFNRITWKDSNENVRPVFGNSGILAGYDPKQGFRIYLLQMGSGLWYPVDAIFQAKGSGSDAAELSFVKFSNRVSSAQRRDGIDRVEATMALIRAVNEALYHNLGVGGYMNLIFFDSQNEQPEKRYYEINDHRSKLASEIILAQTNRYLSDNDAYDMIDMLLFRFETFDKVHKDMWNKLKEPNNFHRFLRGYTQLCW